MSEATEQGISEDSELEVYQEKGSCQGTNYFSYIFPYFSCYLESV